MINVLVEVGNELQIEFDPASYPSANELRGWMLTLGGGVELPFTDATVDVSNPYKMTFASYDPNWTAGDQVVVSIRTKDVQNRYGQVALKARRSTRTDGDNNILYGKSHYTYARGTSRFGPGGSWELQNLRVTTDKTGAVSPRERLIVVVREHDDGRLARWIYDMLSGRWAQSQPMDDGTGPGMGGAPVPRTPPGPAGAARAAVPSVAEKSGDL